MALIDVNGKRFKNFMTKLYGLGAAVVIMGALFKIIHLKGADLMLIIGLTTEAVIFAISAFEAQPKEYDWTLAYPELENEPAKDKKARKFSSGLSTTQELDRMLEDAKIGPDLLESLSAGDAAIERYRQFTKQDYGCRRCDCCIQRATRSRSQEHGSPKCPLCRAARELCEPYGSSKCRS